MRCRKTTTVIDEEYSTNNLKREVNGKTAADRWPGGLYKAGRRKTGSAWRPLQGGAEEKRRQEYYNYYN